MPLSESMKTIAECIYMYTNAHSDLEQYIILYSVISSMHYTMYQYTMFSSLMIFVLHFMLSESAQNMFLTL